MIHILELGLGGQEWIWIFLFTITVIFIVNKIKRDATIKAENRILRQKWTSEMLLELLKLKQTGAINEDEFQKKKEEVLKK